MKPLIEQLTEENQNKLKEYYIDLLPTYRSILIELDRAKYNTQVQTDCAFQIYNAIYPDEVFNLNRFWYLFKRTI